MIKTIEDKDYPNHLYIHIPFFFYICSYCDFCKMFKNDKMIDNYLDALNPLL